MKKLAILAFTVVFVLMAVLPAAAAVIDTSETISITIHKYAIEEGMILDYKQGGLPIGGDTAIGEGINLEDLYKLNDVEFTIIRVGDTDTDPNKATALTGASAYSATEKTVNGQVTFSGLAVGVYLVTEVSNSAILEPVAPFLINAPMTNPTGDGWIYDIHVYLKNELVGAPEIDKFVGAIGNKYQGAALGGETTWFITSQIPASGIGEAKKFMIHDDLHKYLTYVENSIDVKVETKSNGEILLVKGTDYTLSPTAGGGFDVVFTTVGLKKIEDGGGSEGKLVLTYKTILDIPADELEEALATPISGNAYDTFINAAGVPYSASVEDKPAIHTGGFNISKVDGVDEAALSGAQFKIYTSEEDAKAGTNAVVTPFGTTDWEVTTASDGTARFYGLAYGANGVQANVGETTYWIVETQAPNGYNLLKAPVSITVDAASHLEENEVIVKNFKGFILPATGGIGTTIFTASGLALIALAVALHINAKKRGNI